jgi:hypothetical protein
MGRWRTIGFLTSVGQKIVKKNRLEYLKFERVNIGIDFAALARAAANGSAVDPSCKSS